MRHRSKRYSFGRGLPLKDAMASRQQNIQGSEAPVQSARQKVMSVQSEPSHLPIWTQMRQGLMAAYDKDIEKKSANWHPSYFLTSAVWANVGSNCEEQPYPWNCLAVRIQEIADDNWGAANRLRYAGK